MAELFNVVFAGELVGRADPAVVRANVGKLFNASEAVLDKLFSGQPVAIKKMVDRATAMQLRARLKQAGAETRLVQVDEEGRPVAVPAATAAPPPAAPAPATVAPVAPAAATAPAAGAIPATAPAGSMAARLQAQAAPVATPVPAPTATGAPAGDWGIKPVGTRLSDPAPPPPPAPDTSAISLAKAGGDLVSAQELPRPAPVQVDISALSMAAAGTDVLKDEERRPVTPVQVDLSGISLAAVGAPLDELREDKPLVNPDISHLKLAD